MCGGAWQRWRRQRDKKIRGVLKTNIARLVGTLLELKEVEIRVQAELERNLRELRLLDE